jgi:LacI family transcriptional regulator
MEKRSVLTVYDIARIAKVSPATVSRVLNRNPNVSLKTTRKVNEIITGTGFKPRWKAGGSKIIGILLPDFDGMLADPYIAAIISVVYDLLKKEEYSMELLCPEKVKLNPHCHCSLGTNHQLNGMVAVSAPHNYKFCENLLANSADFPCVVIGKLTGDVPDRTSGFNHILSNDYTAGYQLGTLLARHNHRSFLLVTANRQDICHLHRLEGIIAALRKYGVPDDKMQIREVREMLRQNGEQIATGLACGGKVPDVAVFTQGNICLGFVRGCQSMKLRIPDDFSVATFADDDEFAYTNPPITTMNSPTAKIGEQVVQALLAQINQVTVKESGLIPHVLHNRHSIATRT